MFKKKPVDEKPVVEEVKAQPIAVEEMDSPVEVETSEDEVENSEVAPEEEITEEELKAVIQKLAADVQAIKYHLRLDFI